MQRLRRRDANALRQRLAPKGLGDYGENPDEISYSEGDVFRAATPGQLQINPATGQPIPDEFYNPLSFTPYVFTTNNVSPDGTGNGSVQIVSVNFRRQALLIQNLSAGADLYINFGQGAGQLNGLLLGAGEGIIFDDGKIGCPNNSIFVFYDTATLESGIIIEGAPVS